MHSGIDACSASDIAENVGAGRWTSGAVVRAYIRRAALVHSRHNCLTEIRFKAAIEEADRLDAEYATSKTPRGRLHGVPVSAKEQFHIVGLDTSNGYSCHINKPQNEDATLVQILRAEGAIIIAKTNLPQTLLFFESTNPVFGRTTNPWNSKHAAGGSSGGEAALLAADGSALGLGTDVGGSLRIPTFYCGIYSLKPTSARITNTGLGDPCPGFKSIPSISGPMGRSVRDLDLVARIAFGRSTQSSQWEGLPPIPYRELPADPRPLRLGYYTFDGCIRSSPATQRAVLETVAAMRAAGHEVVEFEPPDVHRSLELFAGITSSDGYETIMDPIGSDPTEKELFLITLGPRVPGFVRWLVGWAVEKIFGDSYFRADIQSSRKRNAKELFALQAQRDDYMKMWYKEVWDRHGFDGIIAPSQAIPAPQHGQTAMVPQLSMSTFLYNILDTPVGVIPVTRVDASKDAATAEWLAREPRGGMIMVERDLYYGKNPIYNAQLMHGLPVGVQIVGKRWEDEKLLRMMELADRALGERGFGPGAWKE
ncbi:amidase signature enzyme [Auricularia subglabra TFB-10046 SS5]|nr:amidase signature enzyme [Auricularia subglabra TFB-10046 SS5]